MFNFIFEGKIAEILAPVSGVSAQLCLAIQHQRNDEVQRIVDSAGVDLQANDSGYSAIHVACRYNNRYAFDLLSSRGVPVDLLDSAGNTPLHFASKYGNIDICKLLVERGCSPGKKNSKNQTAYDVAESHVVRQFLLPLQLKAEREAQGGLNPSQMGYGGYPQQQQFGSGQAAIPSSVYEPQQSYSVPAGASQITPVAPASGGTLQTPGYINPPAPLNLGLMPPSGPLHAQHAPTPPSAGEASPAVPNAAKPAVSSSGARLIQPDGFHTSMSDPKLQELYGHVKATINIAPPPTGPAGATAGVPPPVYSYYGQQQGGGGAGIPGAPSSVYTRYVAYDPHTGAGVPPPPGAPLSVGGYNPSPPGSGPLGYPAAGGMAGAAPGSPHGPPVASPPRSGSGKGTGSGVPLAPGVGLGPNPAAGAGAEYPPGAVPPQMAADTRRPSSGALVNVNVFNPATDHVISADATSSSVL